MEMMLSSAGFEVSGSTIAIGVAVFLLLLTRQLQSRWDDKLRRLFR